MNVKKSGFEPAPDSWVKEPCLNSEHNPPSMLYIPPGQVYRHVCPGCGYECVIYSQSVWMR